MPVAGEHPKYLHTTRAMLFAILPVLLIALTGCGPTIRNMPFKVNSQPEGAHVVFNMSRPLSQAPEDWIYLGNTPLRSVRLLNEKEVEDAGKVTLKVMHAGYYDQVKEWDGQTFWAEAENTGFIFWAPKLIPQPQAE
ncbi:MAG: hypothetical protein D3923_18550 [Candidatus Electrothrix sp. AR3]|nr:hypothetical protein [Candidatus Electrothrix sp. AR3]